MTTATLRTTNEEDRMTTTMTTSTITACTTTTADRWIKCHLDSVHDCTNMNIPCFLYSTGAKVLIAICIDIYNFRNFNVDSTNDKFPTFFPIGSISISF
jgi:hypothetical protein